jgi:hypothetical protein
VNEILISIACLLTVATLSVAAILSNHYRDNWMQFLGLCGVVPWTIGRAWTLADPLMPAPDMSTQQLIGHVGLALFAAGTAWKVWRHRDTPSNPNGWSGEPAQADR